MGSKCFFWKGVRVLGSMMSWKPIPNSRATTEQQGVSRNKGRLSARSPNFIYDIVTKTSVKPQTVLVLGGSKDASPQDVLNLKFAQWAKTMLSLAGPSDPLGPLSWCRDDAEVGALTTIANPGVFPGIVTAVVTLPAGFTPAVDMYVLVREKTSGEGWVGKIVAYNGGTGAISIDGALVAIDATWQIVHVLFHYPSTQFVGIGGYDTATQMDDKWISELTTTFKSASDAVFAPYYVMDLEA